MMLSQRLKLGARSSIVSNGACQLSHRHSCAAPSFAPIARFYSPQQTRGLIDRRNPTPLRGLAHHPTISVSKAKPQPCNAFLTLTRAHATDATPTPNATPATPASPIPRHLYSRARRKRPKVQVRNKTSLDASRDRIAQKKQGSNTVAHPKGVKGGAGVISGATSQAKHVAERLPHIPKFHRPTKEELLSAATGFWSRMRIRFKWLTIRSLRPFNSDDISAFFSWILVGHVIWIIVGTTTFFSLIILAVNTVFAQETLAGWVGNYLTKSSGVKVVFESAVVPGWRDGVITFKNVFVSRRPGDKRSEVRKGSQTAAAAAAAELASERATSEAEETNYTQYDLSIETVNVTLSFTKWFNGHGLLRDVEVSGVRGVLDRTAVHYSAEDLQKDPRSYKHEANTGDFEIESFKMDDLLISVYQPNNFRPFSVSIFSAELPRLRKQWLFYDFLSADHMSGSFDDSLFTIHPRQTHNYTGTQLADREKGERKAGKLPADAADHWDKQSRIRVDGLKIDHLNRGVEGPFSWISEGTVDVVADVMFPANAPDGIVKVVSDIYDRVEAQVLNQRSSPTQQSQAQPSLLQAQDPVEAGLNHNRASRLDGQGGAITPPRLDISLPEDAPASTVPPAATPVILDLSITLTNVHASIPLFPTHISYINAALIRPIVAYINTHSGASTPMNRKPHIPIHCRVVKDLADFEGSWTVFDSGLMDDLSRETYEAFVRGVNEKETRGRRMRKVGFWGLQVVVQALVLGLAGRVA